jgi:hypothetical protein
LSAVVTGAIYLFFAVLTGRARLRGSSGDCGCFGALPASIDNVAVIRSAVFAALCACLAYARLNAWLPTYEVGAAAILFVLVTLGGAALQIVLEIRLSRA